MRLPKTRRSPISITAALAGALSCALVAGCADHQPLAPSSGDATLGRGVGPHGGGPPVSVVFYSTRDGNQEIYRMNADGSDQGRITTHPARDYWPDLSPNGQYLAFVSERTGNAEIFVLNLRTGELTNVSNSPADDSWPRWSPNGRQIAFHSNRDGNFEIYVVDLDGTGLTRVTVYPGLDQWPEWSPNGQQFAIRRDMDVYLIDADGSNPVRLTTHPALDQMASWSPNGKQLAFMSLREGYCSVFLMNADGSEQTNLTPKAPADPASAWCSRAPSWSRNGKQIYFMSLRPGTGGSPDIFVMDADGSNQTRLTFTPGEDGGPTMR